jgi:hypothetical protein
MFDSGFKSKIVSDVILRLICCCLLLMTDDTSQRHTDTRCCCEQVLLARKISGCVVHVGVKSKFPAANHFSSFSQGGLSPATPSLHPALFPSHLFHQ